MSVEIIEESSTEDEASFRDDADDFNESNFEVLIVNDASTLWMSYSTMYFSATD